MSAIAEARRAIDVGDSESALRHLLVAWREHRLPRLADLIDRVSAKITAAREPIGASRIVDLHELIELAPEPARMHSRARSLELIELAPEPARMHSRARSLELIELAPEPARMHSRARSLELIELAPEPARMHSRARSLEHWSIVEQLRDPGDLERLLAVKLPSRWKEGLAWLNKLADWPDDPRLSVGLAALVSNKPYKSMGSEPFWCALLDLLVRQRDARVLDTLQGANLDEFSYSFRYKELFASAIKRLTDGLSHAQTHPLTTDGLACCEAMERAMAGAVRRQQEASRTEEDFLAEIFASPERDDVRQVYADWLMQRDDPRGEFIALQIARARTGAAPGARERALLKKHQRELSGPLDPVLRTEERHFERGFLARAIGRWDRSAAVDPLVGDPYWATVYALTGPEHGRVPVALVTHPVMRSLTVLHNVWSHTLRELDALERPLPILELGVLSGWDHALGQRAGLSLVRRLLVRNVTSLDRIDWLWASPLFARVFALSLAVFYLEHSLQYLDRILLRAPATLTEVTLMDHHTRWPGKPEGWCLRFVRDAEGKFTSLDAAYGAHHRYTFDIIGGVLAEVLAQLAPDGIRRLVVRKTPALKPTERQQAALTAAIRRLSSLEHIELPFDLD